MNLTMVVRPLAAAMLLLCLGCVGGETSIVHSFQEFELDLTLSIGLQCTEVGGLSEQVRSTAESVLEDEMEAQCGVQPVSVTLNEKACSGAFSVKVWDGSMEVASLSCADLGSCVKGIMESDAFLSRVRLHYSFIQGVTYEVLSTCPPTPTSGGRWWEMIAPSQSPTDVEELSVASMNPSSAPSIMESMQPSVTASMQPSIAASMQPSIAASMQPSVTASMQPSVTASMPPSAGPTQAVTAFPTFGPTSSEPSSLPSAPPSLTPSVQPSKSQAPSEPRTMVQASFENMSLQMGMTELLSDDGLAQVEKSLADTLQDFLEGRRRRRRMAEQGFRGGVTLVETNVQIRNQSLETGDDNNSMVLLLIFDQSIVYTMAQDATWTPYQILSQSLGDSLVLDQVKTNLVDSSSDFQALTSVYGLQMGNLIQQGGSTDDANNGNQGDATTSNSATDNTDQDTSTDNGNTPNQSGTTSTDSPSDENEDESSESSSNGNNSNNTIVLAAALAGGALIGVLGMAGHKRIFQKGKTADTEDHQPLGFDKGGTIARKPVGKQIVTKQLLVEAFLDESVETESSFDVEV